MSPAPDAAPLQRPRACQRPPVVGEAARLPFLPINVLQLMKHPLFPMGYRPFHSPHFARV